MPWYKETVMSQRREFIGLIESSVKVSDACRHRQGSPIQRCGATCLRACLRAARRQANAQAGVTAKPSIHAGACFINPAFTHRRSCVLPREVCTVSTGWVD